MVADKASLFFTGAFPLVNGGYAPYPWQTAIYNRFVAGHVPPLCSIPTGLGKTSVIPIWLLALAWQSHSATAVTLPRRLVYIVNRRTVVDQATSVAEGLQAVLRSPAPNLQGVTIALHRLGTGHVPGSVLAVSTLRGQLADNEEWKWDPARPSIIIGTVDMVGSKLLFNGYGDGRWKRAFHAGLLGHDVLYIHDEAHLSPAFGSLLKRIAELQTQHGHSLKSFHVMEMSATPVSSSDSFFSVGDEDRRLPSVIRRLQARKTLHLQRLPEGQHLVDELSLRAVAHEGAGSSVLIYVRTPELASRVAGAILKKAGHDRLRVLTGTMRGYERDGLTNDQLYHRFLPERECTNSKDTCYLVSTSAGEVGVDIDADAGVFDLTTLDSAIQRLGRINRTGGRAGRVDLLIDTRSLENDESQRLAKTVTLLETLPQAQGALSATPEDVSSLARNDAFSEACQLQPRMRTLEPYLLDTWSLTGLEHPAGPRIAPWLHGIVEEATPDTWFVWRASIPPSSYLERWLEAYPVATREKARLPQNVAAKYLEELVWGRQAEISGHGDLRRAVLVAADGSCKEIDLEHSEQWQSDLAYATVILNAEIGGLTTAGLPDAQATLTVSDVSNDFGSREGWSICRTGSAWKSIPIGSADSSMAIEFDDATLSEVLISLEKRRGLQVILWSPPYGTPETDDEPSSMLVYLQKREGHLPDDHDIAAGFSNQLLDDHLKKVGTSARILGAAVNLPPDLVDAMESAGSNHDLGKARRWWQLAAGNTGADVYAKYFGRKSNWKLNQGYRHEFGSLLDVLRGGRFNGHPHHDLILHLISSHHGYARPELPERAYDRHYARQQNVQAAKGLICRFEDLQRKYGWWTLAYIEALLKAADMIGSVGDQ